jgi:hypothetical protein
MHAFAKIGEFELFHAFTKGFTTEITGDTESAERAKHSNVNW